MVDIDMAVLVSATTLIGMSIAITIAIAILNNAPIGSVFTRSRGRVKIVRALSIVIVGRS